MIEGKSKKKNDDSTASKYSVGLFNIPASPLEIMLEKQTKGVQNSYCDIAHANLSIVFFSVCIVRKKKQKTGERKDMPWCRQDYVVLGGWR